MAGSNPPSRSCRGAHWNRCYTIAELLEFLDHSGSARTLGLGTDRRTAFLVVDSLMQNLPKHSAKSMGYGPDCPSANACLGTPLRSLRPQDTPPTREDRAFSDWKAAASAPTSAILWIALEIGPARQSDSARAGVGRQGGFVDFAELFLQIGLLYF